MTITSTVLVVEQDILIRQPLAQYLRECGYTVIEANGVDEARKAFSRGDFRLDVALINLQSSTESGFALASWIRDHCPDVEVVLAGTIATSLQSAENLCDDERAPGRTADHRPVLDHIRRLLANRDRAAKSNPDKS